MSQYVVPPPVMFPPVRRNPEKARRMRRLLAPLAIGAVVFPFFWGPTISIPPDPGRPIENLSEIRLALTGQMGAIQSMKVSADINRNAEAYAQVVEAGAKVDPAGKRVLEVIDGSYGLPSGLVESLGARLHNPDWRVRRAVARIFRQLTEGPWYGYPEADSSTTAAQWLSDPSPEVRQEAVDLIGSQGIYAAGDVRSLTMSKDPGIKLDAVRALARSGTDEPQDIALFKRLQKNPDRRIREAAYYGLRH